MTVTMFISMWMLNFFVVVMMSTICLTILEQFEGVRLLIGCSRLIREQFFEPNLLL